MRTEGRGQLLKIYLGERDRYQSIPLYHAIVMKARQMGMGGATVYRGMEGYGARNRIRPADTPQHSEDMPVIVEIVDYPERIAALLAELDRMVAEGLVFTLDDVQMFRYRQHLHLP